MTDNLETISLHKETPKIVNAIVEIPKGTSAKYEYDSELNIFKLKRCLTPGLKYPCSYGFIPNTLAGDGDCLDILIYSDLIINNKTLILPHPEIQNRDFVLMPLAEIAPDLIVTDQKNVVDLLEKKKKFNLDVKKISNDE